MFMTTAELSLTAFAVCNALRIAAYFPQMVKIARHPQGAAGFSYATWTLFTAANASTALYAASALNDVVLAWAHALSAVCCLMLLALAAWRTASPVASPVQRAGTPAACRSARKAVAHGSTRIGCSIKRRRSMLLNAPLRKTVA